jgi:diguanylate cyclase (GGDEF)-like protein
MIFEAHHIAYTDELTGILGRRALMESFLGLGKKYTVAMVDIDHFKKFNDTYGHDVGDEVLRRVARVLDKVKEGRAFRYGGEEFTLIFANKKIEEVLPELEYIRRKVESGIIEFKTGIHSIRANVTISIGVAQSDESFKAQDILKFADQALYKAKLSGRNQVVVGDYSPSKVQINHYKKGSKNDEKSSGIGHSTE